MTEEQKPIEDQGPEVLPDQVENLTDEPSESSLVVYHKRVKDKVVQITLAILTLAVVIFSVWGIGSLIMNRHAKAATSEPTSVPTSIFEPQVNFSTPVFDGLIAKGGISRLLDLQTKKINSQQRTEVTKYIVEQGDTIFGIADKFGLKPETVLWSNRYTLGDTPDGISIGFELVILPEDGVYHMWSEGEGLNGVSSFYGVKPEDIVNYPLNNLDANAIGDYADPNIEPGTMLVVPGGVRPTVTWVVARENPAVGSAYLGAGACAGTLYGAAGTGTFVFPTVAHFLSGYDWNPPVHNGLDFDGDSGSLIFAADSGVVVYSGWSTRGYGNLLVVDHDGGWQSIYAHLLDGGFVPCGTNVYQGEVIGYMGSTGMSTGPHLHFELRYNGTAVNPWNFLN